MFVSGTTLMQSSSGLCMTIRMHQTLALSENCQDSDSFTWLFAHLLLPVSLE